MMKPILIMLTVNVIYAISQFTCDPDKDCEMKSRPDLVPDPKDCHNFYVCNDKQAADNPSTCGQQFYFDGLNQSCEEGDCISPLCPDYAPDCKTSCDEHPNKEGFIVFPGECSSYYVCTSVGTFRDECPENEYFNGINCTPKSKDACCNVCGPPICTKEMDFTTKLPDKNNCQNFYICVNGYAFLQTCPEDEMFDLPDAECKTSANAECYIYCHSEDTTTELSINVTDPSKCILIDDYICEEDGVFPLCPTCCNIFVSCLTIYGDLVASESTCPSELFFSPTISTCISLEDCEMILE